MFWPSFPIGKLVLGKTGCSKGVGVGIRQVDSNMKYIYNTLVFTSGTFSWSFDQLMKMFLNEASIQ